MRWWRFKNLFIFPLFFYILGWIHLVLSATCATMDLGWALIGTSMINITPQQIQGRNQVSHGCDRTHVIQEIPYIISLKIKFFYLISSIDHIPHQPNETSESAIANPYPHMKLGAEKTWAHMSPTHKRSHLSWVCFGWCRLMPKFYSPRGIWTRFGPHVPVLYVFCCNNWIIFDK